jgi:UDP-4-amino-4,6-dideoxy-N-acetyl-beta-L-altrosamine transaminase
MRKLSYSHQCIEQDDIESVLEVLKSDFLTQGPKVKEFEQSLADYCGAKFAVVFSSGTAALHAAYFAADLAENDQIITSPMTFLATANASLFLGAKPTFVDIESDTGNIDTALIERALTEKTKAIVPVHFAGQPAELEKITQIAQKHNLLVIEDACHALGARYKDTTIGDCKYSDMTVFSFHPVKSITTGEGGAVVTNNKEFHNKLTMFRHHGVTKDYKNFKNSSENCEDWYYEMQYLGYNYRLTDIHAALGISQLKKLDKFIRRRRQIVETYNKAFKDNCFFDLPVEKDHAQSAWHLYPIRLKDKYKALKADLFAKMHEKGLGVQVHYIPVHIQPYYQQLGYEKNLCPNAMNFYEREISIPLYPSMTKEDINHVIQNVTDIFEGFE